MASPRATWSRRPPSSLSAWPDGCTLVAILAHASDLEDWFLGRCPHWRSPSLVAEELFWDLEGPIVRVTTPHVPLPSADALEDAVLPSADKIVANVLKLAD